MIANNRMTTVAKSVGIAASITALILWIIFIGVIRDHPQFASQESWTISAVMIALALAGALTAWIAKPLFMILIFVCSFFPVGLYLLGVPSIFRLIGIADLVFLLAGILILAQRYKIQRA